MWSKHINLTGARALSHEFCKDFDICYCEIYYVDRLGNKWINTRYGEYIYLTPPHALILDRSEVINKIGIVMHELAHHLEHQYYAFDLREEPAHGYHYQLAKERVVSWCRKNISNKPNWYHPLKSKQIKEEMIAFQL